tara:strand:+ start:329 stop:529 length:201 start_codon:yes stop_codon:yes gene_type:complete
MNVSLHGPLYVKARTALDKKMQDSSKAGKKSSRKPVKTLEPDDILHISWPFFEKAVMSAIRSVNIP